MRKQLKKLICPDCKKKMEWSKAHICYKKKNCPKCFNFGWWAIGDLVPLGEIDAREYEKFTIKCPWCNAGFEKGKRYELLKKLKKQEDEKQKI